MEISAFWTECKCEDKKEQRKIIVINLFEDKRIFQGLIWEKNIPMS
jgi:hypothetical protein